MGLDDYVVDVLMADLAGHDRSPAAFLVYLRLWRLTRGRRRVAVTMSLQEIAEATGLSKSAVQHAVRRLKRRRLLRVHRDSPTAAPSYRVLRPWNGVREG